MTIMLKKGKQQLIADLISRLDIIPNSVNNMMRGGRYVDQYNPTIEDLAHKMASRYMEEMCIRIKAELVYLIQEHLCTQEEMEKDLNLRT